MDTQVKEKPQLTLVVTVKELCKVVETLYQEFRSLFGSIPFTDIAEQTEGTPLDHAIKEIEGVNTSLWSFHDALRKEIYHKILPQEPKKA